MSSKNFTMSGSSSTTKSVVAVALSSISPASPKTKQKKKMSIQSSAPDSSRKIITLLEFANAIRVSKRQFYRLIDEKEVPRPAKIGKTSCYCQKDLDAYLAKIEAARS
ncbi:MAG: hypothetical protein P1U58_13855 [Verrucomicrobiales bacterium]|nr:hypothetical protein [Verrucomicrobiales bacterium]